MNVMRTGILLAAMTAILLVVGQLLAGEGGMMIALIAAVGMNAFAYWNSASMVLRMHGAREVDAHSAPELYQMVRELAGRAELPMPEVYIIDNPQPNAFATGRNPENAAVAATTGIMQTLSREELAGVMAHELAHIQNRDTLTMTVAATIAGAIGFLSQFAFLFGGSRGENRPHPIIMLLVMILAPLAAAVVQMAISRTREYSADRSGAEICGNPRWLASALQRIEQAASGRVMTSAERNPSSAHLFIINPLHGGGISALFRTHPPTDERVRRLLDMPTNTGKRPISREQAPSRRSRRGSVPVAGNR